MKRALLIAAALTLAACSGSTGESTPPSAAPASSAGSSAPASPSPSPTPSPTVLTKAAAAAYYLEWICPSNRAKDAVVKAIFKDRQTVNASQISAADIRRIKSAAKVLASESRQAAAAFDAPPTAWPGNVQKPVNRVVGDLLDDVTWAQAIVRARGAQGILDAYGSSTRSDVDAAQLVRLRLGLPAAGQGCPK